MVAYAQALQFWTEKANLPTQGQPHLLVGSIVELIEAMECYVSFPNDAVFSVVALPEESLTTQSEKTAPKSTHLVSTNSPIEEAAVKVAEKEAAPIVRPPKEPSTSWTPNKKSTRRKHSPNWFSGWRKVIHPSRVVTDARQIPSISQSSKWRPCSKSSGERIAQCQRAEEQVQNMRSEHTSPAGMLETSQQVMPPPGFQGVMSCLLGDPLPVDAPGAPPDPLQLAAVIEPTVATMSASCIVKDEASGVTYMDTMTISMGQVALSGPNQGTPAKGSIIENITGLS